MLPLPLLLLLLLPLAPLLLLPLALLLLLPAIGGDWPQRGAGGGGERGRARGGVQANQVVGATMSNSKRGGCSGWDPPRPTPPRALADAAPL